MMDRRLPTGALAGGVAAGAIDLAYAAGMAIANGRSPMRMLQGIASGIEGQAAFDGGVASAALGAASHFAITIGAAFVYLAAYLLVPLVRRQFALATLLFGIGVYAVMHGAVLPMSNIPFKMTYTPATLAQGLAVHVFLVALPIAWCVRRFGRSSAGRLAGGGWQPSRRREEPLG